MWKPREAIRRGHDTDGLKKIFIVQGVLKAEVFCFLNGGMYCGDGVNATVAG